MTGGTVAVIGRPNVGKSTLFNRITGGRKAIVADRPGVTRDRNFALADWAGHGFWIIDTGGWTGAEEALSEAIRNQIQSAIATADVLLLVVDGQEGVHPTDLELAELLRPHQERVMVAANKLDELPDTSLHLSFFELGLGDPVPISATTGKGTGDFLDLLVRRLPAPDPQRANDTIHVAIVGRPNVGKSSLMNRLLGEERAVVDSAAGTTRDALDSPLRYHGRTLNFIDTAGLRKRSKVEDEIEFYSTVRTERAIARADVCVVVVDATMGIESQDVKIAQNARAHGSSVLVAVNKWDLIEDKDSNSAWRGKKAVAARWPFLREIPFVYTSVATGQRVRKILEEIITVAANRESRIPTAEVNRVLTSLVDRNQPPQQHGREVKLLYASQISVKPPTFAIVANRPDALPESYRRYIERGFREAWDFAGVPLRLKFRRRAKTQ